MARRLVLAGLGLLLVTTAFAYLPSIDGEFLFDDYAIVGSPLVADPLGQSLSDWISSPRPVLTATYALNSAAVGLDTRGWHLTNVLVHLASVLLAWLVARAVMGRAGVAHPDGPALFAAALFALHPLQTESVSYIAQRAESLASGLYLAALLALLHRDLAATSLRRTALLAAAVGLEALGLLVKPIVATLPGAWLLAAALLPVSDEAELPTLRRIARRLGAAAPLFALAVAAAVWGISTASGSLHAGFEIPGLPADRYVAAQLRAIPLYLKLLAWPAGQCADWYFRTASGLLAPASLAGGAFLAAFAGGALWLALRARSSSGDGPAAARLAGFGALFFLLALAPSSLVPLKDPVAEHRVYLASLGLFIAVAGGGAAALRRLDGPRAVLFRVGIAIAIVAAAGVATAARNRVWTGPLALFEDALIVSPLKARIHMNLGHALSDAGRKTEALERFRKARELSGDGTVEPGSLVSNVVVTLLAIGRPDEARAEVQRALEGSPRDAGARALLANVEFFSGRPEASERAALAALEVDPGQVLALKYLGMVRIRRGDLPGALVPLRYAAALLPVDPGLFVELGSAEEKSGNLAAACRAYARAAELPLNKVFAARGRAAFARAGCR